jgi:hypothetical protein
LSAISTTALDLITGGMRNIGALEAGETPNAQDANDALQVLNDMLESWSTDHLFIYASVENILTLIPGQYQYLIGTGATFNIPRPLRITNAFTRITASGTTGLDYPINIVGRDKYVQIGLKSVMGPWPTILYYDPTYPNGNIYFYPNPSQAGELHLWTDTILADFANLAQPIALPQGYARAIKKNLALELAPEYGKSPGPMLVKQAMESKMMIKQLNSIPDIEAFFDQHIIKSRRNDASFIFDGGFNR